MRWTKGKPAAKAPYDVPVLAVFEPTEWEKECRPGVKPYYRVVTRRRTSATTCEFLGPGQTVLVRQPDRFWTLPEGM